MILVFGSINADLIVPVPRLPRPSETVLGDDYALLPGGKGANQALAARRAGAAVLLAGAVGADAFADIALDLLRREGVDTRLVQVVEQPTGCAAIMVSKEGENLIAVASSANMSVRSGQVADELLGPDVTLVAQMAVPSGETEALIRRMRAHHGRVLLNLAPAFPIDPALLGEIDLVIANESEATTLGSDPARLAVRRRKRFVQAGVAAGSVAVLRDGMRLEVPALPIEPLDTTGAGDTFVGGSRSLARSRVEACSCPAPGPRRGGPCLPGARRAHADAR